MINKIRKYIQKRKYGLCNGDVVVFTKEARKELRWCKPTKKVLEIISINKKGIVKLNFFELDEPYGFYHITWLKRYEKSMPKKMKVLELGCGGLHFHKNKKERYCYDMDKTLKCKRLKIGNFNNNQKLPYPNNYFDQVLSSHFVEHVIRIDLLMKEVHRILKPGGTFDFHVPHKHNLESHLPPDHYHAFILQSFDHKYPEAYWMKGWETIKAEFHHEWFNKFSVIHNIVGITARVINNFLGKWGEYFFPYFNKFSGLHFIIRKKVKK